MTPDWQRIWSSQTIDAVLSDGLATVANAVNAEITHPPAGISNISEWAKREACWAGLSAKADDIAALLPEEFWASLTSVDETRQEVRSARQTQKIDDGIEIQRQVIEVPSAVWQSLSEQLSAKRLLTPKELGVMKIAAQMPAKLPTENQSRILLAVLEKGRQEGLQLPEASADRA